MKKIDEPSFVFVKKITCKHIANRKFPIKDWLFYNVVWREICTIKKITEEDLVSSSSPSPVCTLRSLLPDISHVFTLSRYLAVTPRLCVIERGHQCFVMRRRLNIAGPSSGSSIKYVRDVLSVHSVVDSLLPFVVCVLSWLSLPTSLLTTRSTAFMRRTLHDALYFVRN